MKIRMIGCFACFGNPHNILQTRLSICWKFDFPGYLFGKVDCAGRLKAVSTACFFDRPNRQSGGDDYSFNKFKKIILATGMIVSPENGRLAAAEEKFAIATPDEQGMTNSGLTVVLIEEYQGVSDLVAVVENLKITGVIDIRAGENFKPMIAPPLNLGMIEPQPRPEPKPRPDPKPKPGPKPKPAPAPKPDPKPKPGPKPKSAPKPEPLGGTRKISSLSPKGALIQRVRNTYGGVYPMVEKFCDSHPEFIAQQTAGEIDEAALDRAARKYFGWSDPRETWLGPGDKKR